MPAAPRSPARRGRAHVTLLTGRRSSAHCDNARPPEALVTFPVPMSSLPVTCRSPAWDWHSGDEGNHHDPHTEPQHRGRPDGHAFPAGGHGPVVTDRTAAQPARADGAI